MFRSASHEAVPSHDTYLLPSGTLSLLLFHSFSYRFFFVCSLLLFCFVLFFVLFCLFYSIYFNIFLL